METSTTIEKKLESFSYAKRHGVLVTEVQDDLAKVIHRPNPSLQSLVELRRFFKRPLQMEEVSEENFASLLAKTYEKGSQEAMQVVEDLSEEFDLQRMVQELPKTEDLLESENDAPIIRLLNALISEAIKLLASDIHIETFEDKVTVRFRIDGNLRKMLDSQRVLAPLLVSRIKVMAKLDIAEKRLPQDGRITIRIAGRAIDVRVSTLPSSHGERVVLRLLDKKGTRLNLSELGMSKKNLELMQDMIVKPHGIILVTGPTGSGKTTTLYAALSDLNDPKRNIMTVEDPIEYDLVGIGQTQVNTKVEMSFARGLRAILRQDPDVVMVGEIRDIETAKIAVQASLTGHLVLSTLHTNSAVGAITRLKDMGIETYLLSSTLLGIVAQRLVRLLCQSCKAPYTASHKECVTLDIDPSTQTPPTLYRAVGCDLCGQTGYSKRTGIYEFMVVDDTLRNMIHENVSEHRIEAYVRSLYASMRQDGFEQALAGNTTLEEVIRVTLED